MESTEILENSKINLRAFPSLKNTNNISIDTSEDESGKVSK
jgi:hypothetical protein